MDIKDSIYTIIMSPYTLEIQETGKISLYIEDGIKLFLSIENEIIKVKIHPIQKELWKGTYIPKKEITNQQVNEWREKLHMNSDLYLDKDILDIARTHPRHAKNYNLCSQSLHQIIYPNSTLNKESMKAYNNGLTFIGDAIIQFVLSVFLYHHLNPSSTTEEYQNRLYLLKHNSSLSQIIKEYNFDNYLAYGKKQIPWHSSKMEKIQADLMKSFIGAIYQSNCIEDLPDVLEVIRKMVIPSSTIRFTSHTYDYLGILIGLLFGIAIGIMIFITHNYFTETIYMEHYEL